MGANQATDDRLQPASELESRTRNNEGEGEKADREREKEGERRVDDGGIEIEATKLLCG